LSPVLPLFSSLSPPPPISTLFPYTTLFRSGSTNGSAWNAAFVFNGTDRLGGKSPEPQTRSYEPGHHYPMATQTERDHIPIVPPSDRKSTRLNSSHVSISYAVFCLKKKKKNK